MVFGFGFGFIVVFRRGMCVWFYCSWNCVFGEGYVEVCLGFNFFYVFSRGLMGGFLYYLVMV